MRTLSIIARLIVGSVFIFSGFVKGIDPMGSTYKFLDYFTAFRMDFINFLAFPLALLLSTTEFLIGISVMFGWKHKTGAWLALLFIVFFTILTFILALTNPVTDCGCFGDAIVMTNWQTFLKNTILLLFVVCVFYLRNQQKPVYSNLTQWSIIILFTVLFALLEWYNYRHLPILDFRPYKIGAYIPDGMNIPEGAPQDEYRTYLYYEKDGKTEEFTEENFPWEDTSWIYVDSKHVLVKKGYEPPIHDLSMVAPDGYDRTDLILHDENYVFLLISHDLSHADRDALAAANDIAMNCISMNCSFFCLTSSLQSDIEQVRSEINPVYEFLTTDEITLKTIIRSNPGLMLIKDGVILAKWHLNDFPEPGIMDQRYLGSILSRQREKIESTLIVSLLSVFLVLVVAIRILVPRKDY
jgi:uncharacterized membrane protein YphA (DoxX/SURF4 family)